MRRYITAFSLLLFIASCRPPVFPPKPQGYFRIDTPSAHQYQLFDRPGFPYTFEYPVYSNIQKDTIFTKGNIKDNIDNTYWINIYFPSLSGVINISYMPINAKFTLDKLEQDAYDLSFFHHSKAEYMNEKELSEPGKYALLYVVGGNAASRYQFTATDSVKHFMRGALYFDVTPNADSLKPATDFLEQDIKHMLMTLKWK